MQSESQNLVILGASSDIGIELTRKAVERANYKLLLVTRRSRVEMKKSLDQAGMQMLPINDHSQYLHNIDLTKEKDLLKLRKVTEEFFTTPFSVVHSVGEFWYHKPLVKTAFSEIRSMYESHYLTFAGAAFALVPVLAKKGGGRIVAFSCNSVLYNYPDMSPFTSAKAAIESFIKCLAHEYAEQHVATTALALPTILTKKVLEGKLLKNHKDYITPEELANIVFNNVLCLPHTVSGNVQKVFKYNRTYYHSGYFSRNPREQKR